MGEPAGPAEAVVEGDVDHSLLGERGAVVEGVRPAGEGAAVDPHHHRQLGAGLGVGRGEDVDVEAVLRGRAGARHGHRRTNAGPARRRLGRAPAQVAHRRSREGDAAIDVDAVGDAALHLAGLDLDDRGVLRQGRDGGGTAPGGGRRRSGRCGGLADALAGDQQQGRTRGRGDQDLSSHVVPPGRSEAGSCDRSTWPVPAGHSQAESRTAL